MMEKEHYDPSDFFGWRFRDATLPKFRILERLGEYAIEKQRVCFQWERCGFLWRTGMIAVSREWLHWGYWCECDPYDKEWIFVENAPNYWPGVPVVETERAIWTSYGEAEEVISMYYGHKYEIMWNGR